MMFRPRFRPELFSPVRPVLSPLFVVLSLLSVVLLLLCLSLPAAAEPRPGVTVVFPIVDRAARLQYTDAELSALQSALADSAIQALDAEIGVFEFTRAAAPETLRILIGDPARTGLLPIDFTLSLWGRSGRPAALPVVCPFLSAEGAQNPMGGPEAFEVQAATAFRGRLVSGAGELVAKLLSNVCITRNLTPIQGKPLYWVLPFRKDDLRIDSRSRFEFLQSLPGDPLGRMFNPKSEVKGAIPTSDLVLLFITVPDPDPDALGNPSIKTDEVYLLEYRRASPVSASRPLP